ncbi:MAG: hypothetical protein U0359_10420 [Byssovorax sp.]
MIDRRAPLLACALLACALLAALAPGCARHDARYDEAARAELEGHVASAAAAYREVCARAAPRCPDARERLERMALRDGMEALAEDRFTAARDILDPLLGAVDAPTRRAAAALQKTPEMTQGLAFERALALPDPADALPAMEALAAAGTRVAPKARVFLVAHRPGILLARAEAACAPEGRGSCAEAVDALSSKHPGSPEADRAKQLLLAEQKRIRPLLDEAERMLKQRVELYDNEQLVDLCMASADMPADFSRAPCETKIRRGRALPSPEALAASWQKILDAIHDTAVTRPLALRFKAAETEGIYDAVPHPDPEAPR